jgi:uncharacterized membrane protein (DUF485 family)
MTGFRDRYERMSDDELIHIALTTELTPEAKAELMEVLSSRGISDLSAFRADVAEEIKRTEDMRESKLNRRKKFVRVRTWLLLVVSICFCAFGTYETVWPNAMAPGNGSTMMFVAAVVATFALITERIDLFWQRHVLYRRPPTTLK